MVKYALSPQTGDKKESWGSNSRAVDPIPDGTICNCEVVKVELRDKPEWMHSSHEPQEVSFRLIVTDGPHKGRNIWGNTRPFWNYSSNCTLRFWVQGILATDELPDDYHFEPDDLAGFTCRALIGARVNQKGETKNFVQDIFPDRSYIA